MQVTQMVNSTANAITLRKTHDCSSICTAGRGTAPAAIWRLAFVLLRLLPFLLLLLLLLLPQVLQNAGSIQNNV